MEMQRYFLGANSPEGFYGYFQQAYTEGWRVWLLKGGPGTGKSTLMRQVAQNLPGTWEWIHCSSDPKSLDAVICQEKKVMIADATAPHSMEALRPGCVERLVDLGGGFDAKRLRTDAPVIDKLFRKNAAMHRRAVHYIAAAAEVQRARLEQATAVLDTTAVKKMVEQYAPVAEEGAGNGEWRQRGLSAVTPDGIVFFKETIHMIAKRTVALNDDWGAAAPVFLSELQELLMRRKEDVTVCNCSLFPKSRIEHILLPRKSTAYVTVNAAHNLTNVTETVELRNTYGINRPGTREELFRMLAQEKQLLETASGCMYQARLIHDELEKHFACAMDFSYAQERTASVIEEIREQW